MKKIFILFFTVIILAACTNESADEKKDPDTNTETGEEADAGSTEQGTEKKDVYQIGETAVITSDMYDFDYEVTVNNFELAKEVEGVKIDEFLSGADDTDRFAVIEVTIKNISDEAYVPNEMFSANFSEIDEEAGHISEDDFFTERDEELAPGEAITGPVVFLAGIDEADTFLMKYEVMTDEETHFELPNPEK